MMKVKMVTILVLLSTLFSACVSGDLIDTARDTLSQVEDIAPELIQALVESTGVEPVDEPTPGSLTEQVLIDPDPADPVGEISQSEDPVLGRDITLEEKTIVRESGDPRYAVQIRYPYLEGDSEAIPPFNSEMDVLVEVVLETFLNDVAEREAERVEGAMQAVSTLDIDYQVTYQEDGLISVYLPMTTYLAISAHPSNVSFSYNYDAINQTFLLPHDLFREESDYFPPLLLFVEEELSTRNFGYQEGVVEEVLLRRDNWNIMQEGLRINFDAYEVGPGAAGPQQVLIPWETLIDLLDPNGPVSAMITR
jgi:hypothetical protein